MLQLHNPLDQEENTHGPCLWGIQFTASQPHGFNRFQRVATLKNPERTQEMHLP